MTRIKRIAISLRWVLLCFWVLCFACGLIWLFGVCFGFGAGVHGAPTIILFGDFYKIFDDTGRWGYIPIAVMYIGLFLFTQWLFLCPRKLWKIKTSVTGRPMKKAAVGTAFATALLFAGLGYSILDLFSIEVSDLPFGISGYFLMSAQLMLWILWSVIFCIYFRQVNYYTWASRIIRGLVAGSILELFVSIPIFATRRDDCYCARGSYAGIIFGATALLWAFGPGVFILFLREKHRIDRYGALNGG